MQQYHNSVRMDEACRLLCSTLMSIGEIADKLGFRTCFISADASATTRAKVRVLTEKTAQDIFNNAKA